MRLPVILLTLSLLAVHTNALGQQIQADYFLFVNLSGQTKTDPTGIVTLEPFALSHIIDATLPNVTRLSSVAVEWSSDSRHWTLKRTVPILCNNPSQPNRGLGLQPVSAEEAAYFKMHKVIYVRLSFFSNAGVFAGETIQKGIVVQDIGNGRSYKTGKGILAWESKQKAASR